MENASGVGSNANNLQARRIVVGEGAPSIQEQKANLAAMHGKAAKKVEQDQLVQQLGNGINDTADINRTVVKTKVKYKDADGNKIVFKTKAVISPGSGQISQVDNVKPEDVEAVREGGNNNSQVNNKTDKLAKRLEKSNINLTKEEQAIIDKLPPKERNLLAKLLRLKDKNPEKFQKLVQGADAQALLAKLGFKPNGNNAGSTNGSMPVANNQTTAPQQYNFNPQTGEPQFENPAFNPDAFSGARRKAPITPGMGPTGFGDDVSSVNGLEGIGPLNRNFSNAPRIEELSPEEREVAKNHPLNKIFHVVALGESDFNPRTIGDNGQSRTAFQIHTGYIGREYEAITNMTPAQAGAQLGLHEQAEAFRTFLGGYEHSKLPNRNKHIILTSKAMNRGDYDSMLRYIRQPWHGPDNVLKGKAGSAKLAKAKQILAGNYEPQFNVLTKEEIQAAMGGQPAQQGQSYGHTIANNGSGNNLQLAT